MEVIENLFGSDWRLALSVIANLILLESLLSVDNAAVLATMVMDLPDQKQRSRALKYGIIGAYMFRGICLILAVYLHKVLWLKALGGFYLLKLAVDHFKEDLRYGVLGVKIFQIVGLLSFMLFDKSEGIAIWSVKILLAIYVSWLSVSIAQKHSPATSEEHKEKEPSSNRGLFHKMIGPFWGTVIAVEMVDLAFSLDNIFAAVAFTDKIGLICLGVFIGILAMRVAAQGFVRLMQRYPSLEAAAFSVIGILGIKLLLSSYTCSLLKENTLCIMLESHTADFVTSGLTVCVFIAPILWTKLLKPANKDV